MLTENIEIAPADMSRAVRRMSHWNNVSKELYNSNDEEHILAMLAVELRSKDRYYVIERIYARYNAVRRNRERVEIKTWRHKRGVREGNGEVLAEAGGE